MKVNISASVDKSVSTALNKFCRKTINNIDYERSKSTVVNEAIKEYLMRNGVIFE